MSDDDLGGLADFRADVPRPDDETAQRIYQVATHPQGTRRRPSVWRSSPRWAKLTLVAGIALATVAIGGGIASALNADGSPCIGQPVELDAQGVPTDPDARTVAQFAANFNASVPFGHGVSAPLRCVAFVKTTRQAAVGLDGGGWVNTNEPVLDVWLLGEFSVPRSFPPPVPGVDYSDVKPEPDTNVVANLDIGDSPTGSGAPDIGVGRSDTAPNFEKLGTVYRLDPETILKYQDEARSSHSSQS